MDMSSSYMPELHVAQQRRRDKLRVQQLEDLQSSNFHHHNNNSSLVYPSEMLNFAVSQSPTFPNIQPSRFVAPSSSDSCDPESLRSCDNWVTSYDDHGRRNLIMSQFGSVHSNMPVSQYFQNNVQNWGNGVNELTLLPAFVSQSNVASVHQAHSNGLSLSLSSEMQHIGEPQELKPSIVKLDSKSDNQMQIVVGSLNHMPRSVGPLGPFTGYTTILKNSKFLKPAQQILDEFFSASSLWHARGCEEVVESVSTSNVLGSKHRSDTDLGAAGDSYRPDCHEKKAKLLHMQEEVCKRHKQYHQQMEMVISAFEAIPGLSTATPYISRSLRTITRHFRCLKNAIAEQIKVVKRALGEELSSPTSFVNGDTSSSRFDHSYSKVKSGCDRETAYASHQNHVWRPQRGLPERAVSILKGWLFDHFLHPYPTDSDKQMLASQTGLSRNQVSNWFINARVRIWKPMVEEIHMLETNGLGRSEANPNSRLVAENHKSGCKSSVDRMSDAKQLDCIGSSSCKDGLSQGDTSTEQLLQKSSRMEHHHQMPSSIEESFISFMPYQRRGLELGGLGPVSLTLGLRHGPHGSETSQQHFQHSYQHQEMHFGGHVLHDFSG